MPCVKLLISNQLDELVLSGQAYLRLSIDQVGRSRCYLAFVHAFAEALDDVDPTVIQSCGRKGDVDRSHAGVAGDELVIAG